FSLKLVAVEVRDALLGGLSGRDPKVPRNRKTHDSDHYAKLSPDVNFHLELLSTNFVVQPIERTASTDSLGQHSCVSVFHLFVARHQAPPVFRVPNPLGRLEKPWRQCTGEQ